MSEHREGWYLERLRDELHRVATLEDERERRPVRGRVLRGTRVRPVAMAIAACVLVATLVVAFSALLPGERERSVAPSPSPAPSAAPQPDTGALRSLDGLYVAQITQATANGLPRPNANQHPPAGVWRIAIKATARTMEVSAPEGPNGGGFTLTVTHATGHRLTMDPDRGCEVPAGRTVPGSIGYSFDGTFLRFARPQDGCPTTWPLLMAALWRKG